MGHHEGSTSTMAYKSGNSEHPPTKKIDLDSKVLFTGSLEPLGDEYKKDKTNIDPNNLVPTYSARVAVSPVIADVLNSLLGAVTLSEITIMNPDKKQFFVMDVIDGERQPSTVAVFTKDALKPMDYPAGTAQFYKVKH